MLHTVLERTPTIDRMNDPWTPWPKEINASTAKSILVIEDDAGIRDTLGEILQEETIHQIFLAQDGETALKMLQTATPDLFLLDYRLPDINGLELLDHIRRIKGYEQTPVVLMSASLSRENITRPHLRYLRKPFDLDRLLQMVEEALAVED
ncbi:MAG TPA: response regulator [Ktedonobacteraceae bacterium]|jgi:CheY-like chemotaxis protein